MRVVEVGQYLLTKDIGNLRQFQPVACREYTLPRDDPASQPNGWIQGNMRIGPVLKVTTSFQHFKYGIETRLWSVGQDNSQSWVRISYGTNKHATDSNHNNTEAPADPHEKQTSQTSVKLIAARSKAKAKPQQREPVDVPSIIPMHKRKWIDIEPSEQNLAAYDLSKKVIGLLRIKQYNGKTMKQLNSTELNSIFEIIIHKYSIGLIIVGNLVWLQEEVRKRRCQYCSDNSGTILHFRALQGHSGNNLIDPTLQDNVVIESGIFHHIYHIGCAFNLHSIVNNGLIPVGQDLSRRQTVLFLPIDPRDKNHKDLEYSDFSVPRRAKYVHSAWKKHQDAVFWVDIDLGIKGRLTFYQTRSNATILQGTLPAYCIPKVGRQDWRSRMRTHTCHLDHHQRSHYVTIGLEGKFHWVLQLINNQTEKLFDSHKKLPDEQNSSNQPNQSRSQSVIDQGNLITRKTCLLLLKVKRPVLKRSMWNLFTNNSVLQIDQGDLISRTTWSVFKHVRLKQTKMSELNKLMIDQANLINTTLQYQTHLTFIMRSRCSTPTMS